MRIKMRQAISIGDFCYVQDQIVATGVPEFTATAIPTHVAHAWADSGFADRLLEEVAPAPATDAEETAALADAPEAAVLRRGAPKRKSKGEDSDA